MTPKHTLISLVAVAIMTATGCYAHGHAHIRGTYRVPAYVTVTSTPPPLRAEVTVKPAQPSPGSVWVHGHWKWEGGAWVWVGGHWTSPPAQDQVWTPPVVVQASGGYRYHPGYWRPSGEAASEEYRQPGVVVVGHGTVTATASGSGTVATTEPASTAAATGAGTVTAVGGATATTSGSSTTATTGGTTATVAPAGTTGTTEPATAGGATTTGATVTATTGSATATATPTTPTAPATGATTTTTPATPATPATASGSGVAATNTTVTGRGNLRCSINTARAPQGGFITVRGNGFGSQTVVRIGAHTAAIVNRRGSELRVQVPRNTAGGMVSVTTNNRSANCGRLQVR
jgi:hypothetical protein